MGTVRSYPEVKRPGREADCSPLACAEIKNDGTLPPTPPVFMAWCLINYAQGQLYFTFTLVPFLFLDTGQIAMIK
jgi:hypothetical protein